MFNNGLKQKEHPISTYTALSLVGLAGLYAGIQNTIAGGGSFITFPALLLTGLSPLDANITSATALFTAQVTSGIAGYKHASGVQTVSLYTLIALSLLGGLLGALLLLFTSPLVFARLVPWLLLFATTIFAYGSFRKKKLSHASTMPPPLLAMAQFAISIYGGYFGAGIGFLMLALLTIAGQPVKTAAATKNCLAMFMNLSAVLIFMFSHHIHWVETVSLSIGGILGGVIGTLLMPRIPDHLLRYFIVTIGFCLTFWMFFR
jgi:uncharacterized protein